MESKKDQYALRILKKYSLLVDFEGEPTRTNVPSPVEGETYKLWKDRVLGDDVKNVVVYIPWKTVLQTKMSTVQEWTKDTPLQRMMKALHSEKNRIKKQADQDVVAVKKSYSSFSKDTLADLVDELGEELAPATKEFFDRFLSDTDDEVETEQLLRELIARINEGARQIRKLESEKLVGAAVAVPVTSI